MIGVIPSFDIDWKTMQRGEMKLIPWHQAARTHTEAKGETEDHWNPDIHKGEAPPDVVQRLQATLPPVIRRTHPERLRSITKRLLEDGLRIYQAKGYVEWPASIREELRVLGWREGDPNLEAQVEDLARRYIVKAANELKEQDRHKIVRDHAGSYSA